MSYRILADGSAEFEKDLPTQSTGCTSQSAAQPDDEASVCAAEHTIALLLALSRNLKTVCRQAMDGGMPYPYPAQWRTQREVEGKLLLLLGLGPIGRELIKKTKGLGLHVCVYAPDVSARELARIGVQKAEELSTALGEADYVSLHDAGQAILYMGAAQFEAMKHSAFFLCTSRTAQVDQTALVQALQNQRLAGAGIALSPQETPPADSPLRQMEQVIFTSHHVEAAARASRGMAAPTEAPHEQSSSRSAKEQELAGVFPKAKRGGGT
ncbi:MAG: hypothetical protein HFF50_01770 [Lawsonibacter sp.]|nr:hypothetical protein [Lawsonibacter sp.]